MGSIKSLLRRWLKPDPIYHIIELEKPRPITDLTKAKDSDSAVASLAGHPGWDYLLAKFKIQKALLERTLHSEPPTDINRIMHLQQGIYWTGWLDAQFSSSRSRVLQKSTLANAPELAIFAEIEAATTKIT